LNIVIESIPIEPMKHILEYAKKQSGDVVIIPQFPGIISQDRDWHLAGIIGGTIVSTSFYNPAVIQKYCTNLWKNPSIPYISLLYKDINPFLKLLETSQEDHLSLLIHSYDINGYIKSVAFGLSVGQPTIENGQPIPNLLLMPYIEHLNSINMVRAKWINSIPVGTLWLDEEKNFQRISLRERKKEM
jgi:hypothetical protein